jgi:uncharacterized repeat protein (TIGR02543 family)
VFAVFVTALTFLSPAFGAFTCPASWTASKNNTGCYGAGSLGSDGIPGVKFTVTTTSLNANDYIAFRLSANTDFWVDWGDGVVEYMNHTGSVAASIYAHKYTSAGTYTIRFTSDNVTAYATGTTPVIQFGTGASAWSGGPVNTSDPTSVSSTVTKNRIAGIDGSLGALFPTVGTSNPNFYQTFYQCDQLTGNIPEHLFDGLSGTPVASMFRQTFAKSTNSSRLSLTGALPAELFSGFSSVSSSMFNATFQNNAGLGDNGDNDYFIPPAFFGTLTPTTTQASNMFSGTGLLENNCPTGFTKKATYNSKVMCACGDGKYATSFDATAACATCTGDLTVNSAKNGCELVCPSGYPDYDAGATSLDECYVASTVACSSMTPTCPANATNCSYENSNVQLTCKTYNDGNNTETCDSVSGCGNIIVSGCNSGYKTTTAGTACEPITYSISFNGNGNTGGSTSGMSNLSYGSPYTLTSNGFTRTGYDFDGWCVGATTCAAADKLANSASVSNLTTTDGATITLYAQWTPTPYTITLNPNGGTLDSGVVNPISYNIESGTVNLPDDPDITQLGYIFDGWCETIDCDSGNETPIKQFVPTSSNIGNKIYYAQWTSNSCDITNHWIPDPNNLNNCICVTGYTDISGVCTPTSYTITYNTNGGTLSGTYPTDYTIESNTITLPDDTNITKLGYSFAGWYDNAGLTGTAVTSIATGSTGNKVYYAGWTANTYNVTYTCDGVTMQTEQATYGTGYTGLDSANVCSEPTGYTLSSFSCDNGVTLPVSDWNVDSAVTCSATNTPKSYTVTYECGSVTTQQDTVTYGVNYTGRVSDGAGGVCTVSLPTGYTLGSFVCTNDTTGNSETIATTATPWGIDSGVTCSAAFIPKTYNVTYECGGATATVDSQYRTATYGNPYTVAGSATVCATTGYTPDSSFVCKDSSDNIVSLPTNSWNVDDDVTCSAALTPKTYNVTYTCGGVQTQQDTVTYGVPYTVESTNICTTTGYTPDQYFVCSETITGAAWNIDDDVTCSAALTPKTYNVTYTCDGVTETVETATYGVAYSVLNSTNVCAATGYEPTVFVCSETITGAAWNIDTDVTCSSMRVPKQYTVTYTCDGVTAQTEQATYGTSYAGLNSANVCSEPTGYTLSPFSCNNNVTLPVSDWNTDAAVTCSATTTPKQYTVTYTCDGVQTQQDTATYDVSYSVRDSATVCAAQGYTPSTFVCTMNISSGIWNTDADVTCSATRTGNTIALTWANGGHGTAPAIPASCTYGSTFNMPAALTDTGRIFDKWNVNGNQFNANAQNVDCNYTTLGVDSGSATITASWTLAPYNITYYNTTGASFDTPNPSTYTIEDTIALVNPTKTGYTFNGWCPGSTTCNNPTLSVSFSAETGDKEYYAKWTPNTITINWANGGHGGTPTGGSASCVYGTTFTTPAALSETGWIFNSWGALVAGQQYDCDAGYLGTITNNSVTITAVWRAESICQGDTIELDSGIVLPTNINNNKKAMAFFNLSEYGGKTASVRGLTTINPNITVSSLKDSSLIRGRWKALSVYPNTDTIWMYEGSALCSATNLSQATGYSYNYSTGNWPAIGDPYPSTASGNNCWCKADKFVADMSNQAATTSNVYAWVQVYPAAAMVVNDSCIDNCAEACAELFTNWRDLTPHTSANTFITKLSTVVGDNACIYNCPEGTVSNLANDGCESEVCADTNGQCSSASCTAGFAYNSTTNACDLNEYSITYNPDGGVLSGSYPTKYTVLSGTVALPTPIKSGYTFIGWHELSNLSDTAVNSFTVNSNNLSAKTFYAEWSTNTYTITYNTNDGTVNTSGVVPVITTDLADSQYSQQYQVTTNTFVLTNPTKIGYTFAGWCFGVDNCSTPELTVTITQGSTGNRTYYAQWTADTYQVNYEQDGGACSGADAPDCGQSTYTIEDTVVVQDPTKQHREFAGWCRYSTEPQTEATICTTGCVNPADTNCHVAPGSASAIPVGSIGERWLYAQFNSFYVYYKCFATDATNAAAPLAPYNDTFTADITGYGCQNPGYHFNGWNCTYEDTTTLNNNNTYTKTQNATCIAQWEANDISLQWNANNGSIGGQSTVSGMCKYGTLKGVTQNDEEYDIDVPRPTRPGYTFNGWNIVSPTP